MLEYEECCGQNDEDRDIGLDSTLSITTITDKVEATDQDMRDTLGLAKPNL